MPFADAVTAVRARLIAHWTETPIAHENVPFTAPEPPAPFIHLSIRGGPSTVASIGAPDQRLVRRQGSVRLTVFQPVAGGDAAARGLVDRLSDLFEIRRFSGVVCHAARIDDGEPHGRDRAWWRLAVHIPFHFDEVQP